MMLNSLTRSDNPPLISIVMNCFNGEEYLQEAIDSIYRQTYKNWEIIFWDNASSDYSGEIAKSFDKRLKYYRSEVNTKLYNARNLALEKCRGSFIAFLDCDDIWIDEKLENQMELALKGEGNDFVYGGYQAINSDGAIIESSTSIKYLTGNVTNGLFGINPISIGCVLIKKSLLEKYEFDPYYELLGDYDLWLRLSIDYPIVALNKVVEYSRQHDNNTSNLLLSRWLKERRYFYKKHANLINFFKYPKLLSYIVKTEVRGIMGTR